MLQPVSYSSMIWVHGGRSYSISGFSLPEQSSIAPKVACFVAVGTSAKVADGVGTGTRADNGAWCGGRVSPGAVVLVPGRACVVWGRNR
jgi:hypothetical protein